MTEVEAETLSTIKTIMGDTPQLTDGILNDVGADELDVVEILMDLEEKFDIEIDESELVYNSTTVQDLADLVMKELS